jgi:soluble lytic murein transglycosylase-like protein
MRRLGGALLVTASLLACSGGGPGTKVEQAADRDVPAAAPTTTIIVTTTTAAPTTTTAAPVATTAPPPGPALPADPAALTDQLVAAEQTIRDPAATDEQLTAAAQLEQLAYRRIGEHPEWDEIVFPRVPAELTGPVATNIAARREFLGMAAAKLSDTLPAWRIVEPAPADELLGYYKEAEAQFGVGWSYLAAINLVETGMGRIVGLSSAGAQGPMQFIPSTWERYGEGDINSPHDSILAAARYLNANGFADGNIDGALFRYNNHNNYVRGVKAYAAIMAAEPVTFTAFHRWRIAYRTTLGDVILPTGYETPDPIPVADYLATHPHS